MFVKQVCDRVMLFNQDMKLVKEFENAKLETNGNRIRIVAKDTNYIMCDMPMENTILLY